MKSSAIFLILFLCMPMMACEDDSTDIDWASQTSDDDDDNDDTSDKDGPFLYPYETVVPSEGLPDEVVLQQANNNLDVVSHEGRIFLAFRTAPSHFASGKATLYVVSSADGESWDFEATFGEGTDLREPRLLSFDGELFLYFALLGTNPLDFEPGGMMVTQYLGPQDWTEPDFFYGEGEGFIPWRTKVVDGVPYMLTYKGGEGIYSLDPEPIDVHWLTTDNGYDWEPVVPGQPVVLSGGGSETDFVFLDDGTLIAVSRNEMGDESGFGMSICRAEAEALGDWNCINDPKKYDSPLMFTYNNEAYLIGRRNLNGTGFYDLGYDDMSTVIKHLLYELLYWLHPKRCSLWKIDPDDLSVTWVLDFPSCGDTCFPGIIQEEENRFAVYNYTSPVGQVDPIWVKGQLGPTHIVRSVLEFPVN